MTRAHRPARTPDPAPPLDDHAREVLAEFRDAAVAMIASLPGAGAFRRAADLERALGTNPKLTWQFWRCAKAADPLAVGRYLPGRAGLAILLEAAGQRGVSPRVRRRVEAAAVSLD